MPSVLGGNGTNVLSMGIGRIARFLLVAIIIARFNHKNSAALSSGELRGC